MNAVSIAYSFATSNSKVRSMLIEWLFASSPNVISFPPRTALYKKEPIPFPKTVVSKEIDLP